jgi:hypothetical protein
LTAGSVYQDPLSASNYAPPNPAFFNIAPTLRWDTYANGAGGLGDIPSSAGGAVDLGGSPIAQFDTAGIDLNWFTTSANDVGIFKLGRFTLSTDAAGTFSLRLDSLDQSAPFLLSGVISQGQLVPEPSSIVLLGVGSLAMMWALRKRAKS